TGEVHGSGHPQHQGEPGATRGGEEGRESRGCRDQVLLPGAGVLRHRPHGRRPERRDRRTARAEHGLARERPDRHPACLRRVRVPEADRLVTLRSVRAGERSTVDVGSLVLADVSTLGIMGTDDELRAELERLKAENEALKSRRSGATSMKVSEKGGLSVYGLGRFPVTLYQEQWLKLLDLGDQIRSFIREH